MNLADGIAVEKDARAVLTVPEAAAHLRVGVSTAYRLIERGTLPAFRVPGTSIVRIRRAALDGLLERWERSARGRRRRR